MPHLLAEEEKLLEKLLLLEKEKQELLVAAPWLGGRKTERLIALLQEQEVLLRGLTQLVKELEASGSFFSAGLEKGQKLQNLVQSFSEAHRKNRNTLHKFGDTAKGILKTLEKACGSKALSIDRQV